MHCHNQWSLKERWSIIQSDCKNGNKAIISAHCNKTNDFLNLVRFCTHFHQTNSFCSSFLNQSLFSKASSLEEKSGRISRGYVGMSGCQSFHWETPLIFERQKENQAHSNTFSYNTNWVAKCWMELGRCHAWFTSKVKPLFQEIHDFQRHLLIKINTRMWNMNSNCRDITVQTYR